MAKVLDKAQVKSKTRITDTSDKAKQEQNRKKKSGWEMSAYDALKMDYLDHELFPDQR